MGKFLTINVTDIDKNLILKRGTEVTIGILKEIEEKSPYKDLPRVSLKETGLFADILSVTREKNYSMLLKEEEVREKVLTAISGISYPEPIFREFEYMKEKSVFTYHHSLATTVITTRIALEFVFFKKTISKIVSANLTKDVGMSRLNKNVLQNTDFLSKDEYELIKEHTLWGLILLIYYMGESLNALIAYRHHDKGIHEDEKFKYLDLIIAVDIFNALISPRPFRKKPFNVRGALDLMTEMGEKKEINLEMVKRLVTAYREDYQSPGEITLSREKLGFIPDDNFYGVKDL